ncbi:MAG: hypothetical protein RLZZ253_1829, partial [Verrucomicrobiota bacterium]
MKPSPLIRPPSLITHTVELLRDGIGRGAWGKQLPGERELSAALQVSRPTLRAALAILEREGKITVRQGQHRRVVQTSPKGRKRSTSNVVVLLSGVPLQEIVPNPQVWTDRFHERMAKAGFEIEMHCGPKWLGKSPERDLELLAGQSRVAAWLLFVSTPAMQAWFQNSRENVVVSGSLHTGIDLPSVDFDHRASCRHAAGRFLAGGHRHLVFVRQTPASAGDFDSESGFREGTCAVQEAGMSIAEHDGSPDGIRKLVGTLLRWVPVPTAFLVARANAALAFTSELIRRGINVPDQASVISRDSDHFLDYFSP